MKQYNILSLFGGIECGRLACERAGIKVKNYFSSEIDKYAIAVTKANWPDVKHVGSVTDIVTGYDRETNITRIYNFRTGENWYFTGKLDMIIGGSPCQGFSFAGLGLNFNDPRSKLFFEFVRLWEDIKEDNPEAKFFLENVNMKKEHQAVISKYLGVTPIMHNSALVSAQNRKRLYWTNIPFLGQPKDKGIVLRDILETEGIGNILNRGEYYERNEKAMCLDASYFKGADNHGQRTQIKVAALTERRTEEAKQIRSENMKNGIDFSPRRAKELVERTDNKSNCLTTSLTQEHIIKISEELILTDKQIEIALQKHSAQTWKSGNKMGAVRFPTAVEGKAKTLVTRQITSDRSCNHVQDEFYYRKLTVAECEALQTLPRGYTQPLIPAKKQISNTQAYKMLGNGWCVDSIVHFFLPLGDASFLF